MAYKSNKLYNMQKNLKKKHELVKFLNISLLVCCQIMKSAILQKIVNSIQKTSAFQFQQNSILTVPVLV